MTEWMDFVEWLDRGRVNEGWVDGYCTMDGQTSYIG